MIAKLLTITAFAFCLIVFEANYCKGLKLQPQSQCWLSSLSFYSNLKGLRMSISTGSSQARKNQISDSRKYTKPKQLQIETAIDQLNFKNMTKVQAAITLEAAMITELKSGSVFQREKLFDAALKWELPQHAITISSKIIQSQEPLTTSKFSDIMSLLVNKNLFSEALKILEQAMVQGYHLEIPVFIPLLKGSGSSSKSRAVLRIMELIGVEDNVVGYTTAIKSCEASGDWKSALELLDIMRSIGLKPNEITYCCAISVASKGNAGDVAINILKEMLRSGLEANAICYASTVQACARCNMWEEVDILLSEMQDAHIRLTESVLIGIINKCRYQPLDKDDTVFQNQSPSTFVSIDRSILLLDKYANLVFNASESLFTMAMDVADSAKRFDLVFAAYERMRQNNILPSWSTFRYLYRACDKLEDPSLASRIVADSFKYREAYLFFSNISIHLFNKVGQHESAIQGIINLKRFCQETYDNPTWTRLFKDYSRVVIPDALSYLQQNKTTTGDFAAREEFQNNLISVINSVYQDLDINPSSPIFASVVELLAIRRESSILRAILLHFSSDCAEANAVYDKAGDIIAKILGFDESLTYLLMLVEDTYRKDCLDVTAMLFQKGLNKISISAVNSPSSQVQFANASNSNATLSPHAKEFIWTAKELFSGHGLPVDGYKTLATIFAQYDLYSDVLDLYETAAVKGVNDILLDNIVVYSLSHSQRVCQKAISILDKRGKAGNLMLYLNGIKACKAAQDPTKALEYLKLIAERNFTLTAEIFNSVMEIYSQSQLVNEVLLLAKALEAYKLPTNDRTYQILIELLIDTDNWPSACVVLNRLYGSQDSLQNIFGSNERISMNKGFKPATFSLKQSDFDLSFLNPKLRFDKANSAASKKKTSERRNYSIQDRVAEFGEAKQGIAAAEEVSINFYMQLSKLVDPPEKYTNRPVYEYLLVKFLEQKRHADAERLYGELLRLNLAQKLEAKLQQSQQLKQQKSHTSV